MDMNFIIDFNLLPKIISKKSIIFIEIGHSQAKKCIEIFNRVN